MSNTAKNKLPLRTSTVNAIATPLSLPATGTVASQAVIIEHLDRVCIAVNVLTGSTAVGTVIPQVRCSYSGTDLGNIGRAHPQSVGPSTEWTNLPGATAGAVVSGVGTYFF